MLTQDTEGNRRYYYEDDYMFFSFAGKYSKNYNLFVTNEKKGYTWYTDSGASIKIEKPLYQDYTYYTGTDRSQKKFDLDVAAEGLTDDEIKEMFLWLEEGATGFLRVDWNFDWGYDVVLAKVTNPQQWGNGYRSVITFKLTFQTIGEFRARAAWDAAAYIDNDFDNDMRQTTIANSYGIPEIDARIHRYDEDAEKEEDKLLYSVVYLPTVGNQYSYIDFGFNGFTSNMILQLTTEKQTGPDPFELEEQKKFLQYTFSTSSNNDPNINYYGRSGFVLLGDKPIEQQSKLKTDGYINNLLRLQGQPPRALPIVKREARTEGSVKYYVDFHIDKKTVERLSYIDNLYISFATINNTNLYGTTSYDIGDYPITYENRICYFPYFQSTFNNSSNGDTITAMSDNNMNPLTSVFHLSPESTDIITIQCKSAGEQTWIQNAPLIYYGSYNILKIVYPVTELPITQDGNNNNVYFTVHKYNNL